MEIDPNQPAFPRTGITQVNNHTGNSYEEGGAEGLTIRAHFAAMAMQGLLSSPDQFNAPQEFLGPKPHRIPAPWYAMVAVQYADALIAELNKPKE